MGHNAIKLELIEWLTKLEDDETIEYLKVVKDSRSENKVWWDDLSGEEQEGINRGLKDIQDGRTFSHEEISKRYGL
ncbi:hypothetical protein [Marinilabilia rubra]|uniref:Addiction module protein n=1 Tax=Marinilabilia rubra TaxID=2162893 RepID=A0A2U2BD02_9BACT|nr:hypothetical protein [Marinilabilia rubra]PWE00907.1 hypothetical protein DDZ16_04515 [Marinilabilia rubra]